MTSTNLECEMCSCSLSGQTAVKFGNFLAATTWAQQWGWVVKNGNLMCAQCNQFRLAYEKGIGVIA